MRVKACLLALLVLVLGAGMANAEVVDSEGWVGEFTSLALDSLGNPHISYYS